jgi:hypothetical protein
LIRNTAFAGCHTGNIIVCYLGCVWCRSWPGLEIGLAEVYSWFFLAALWIFWYSALTFKNPASYI